MPPYSHADMPFKFPHAMGAASLKYSFYILGTLKKASAAAFQGPGSDPH